MTDVVTWAIVPSRNRPAELYGLVIELIRNGVHTVVIDNGGYMPDQIPDGDLVSVVTDLEQPPNLSRLWNAGLDQIDKLRDPAAPLWNVAFFNDDTVLSPGWVVAVSSALRSHDVAAACSDTYNTVTQPTVLHAPDRRIATRMCPWAFMLRGEDQLRADERFRWWWGDTDLDWQARYKRGLIIIPGFPTWNTCANTTTVGELAEQAGRDGEAFVQKYGYRPW